MSTTTRPEKAKAKATLHLTITYDSVLTDVLDAVKEVVEKAREMGAPSGFLEIHSAERIEVDEL